MCNKVLDMFSKKWHPSTARINYITTFCTANWKALSHESKSKHTLSSCEACYNEFRHLQETFPAKPTFVPSTPAITLPEQPSTSKTAERDLAQKVLAEIDRQWEDRYAHSFTDALPTNIPEANLVKKRSRVERKKKKTQLQKENSETY